MWVCLVKISEKIKKKVKGGGGGGEHSFFGGEGGGGGSAQFREGNTSRRGGGGNPTVPPPPPPSLCIKHSMSVQDISSSTFFHSTMDNTLPNNNSPRRSSKNFKHTIRT